MIPLFAIRQISMEKMAVGGECHCFSGPVGHAKPAGVIWFSRAMRGLLPLPRWSSELSFRRLNQ